MIDEATRQAYQLASGSGCLFDVSRFTRVTARGRDRLRILNNVCTADLRQLVEGQGRETFVLDVRGHTVGHAAIFCRDAELDIVTTPGQGPFLTAHIERYVVSESIQLNDRSDALTSFLATGELAQAIAADCQWTSTERLACGQANRNHLALALEATDMFGPPGIVVTVAVEQRTALIDWLDGFSAAICDESILEILRIEQGMPAFGRDLNDRNLPQEIGRDQQAISFNKGCYLGQETVARLDALGHVNRRLVRLVFESPSIPEPGFVIEENEKPIARITSSVFSPSLDAPLAFGFVRASHCQEGKQLDSQIGSARILAMDFKPAVG